MLHKYIKKRILTFLVLYSPSLLIIVAACSAAFITFPEDYKIKKALKASTTCEKKTGLTYRIYLVSNSLHNGLQAKQ